MLPRKRKKGSKFKKLSQNHLITRINQVWEFDIKYGFLHGENRFFFLLVFIDVCTREIKGWYIGKHCKAQDILDTLTLALAHHGITREDELCLRSDNGPQMRASCFIEGLKKLPATHEYIPVRTPNKNAHVESFFAIVDHHLQEQYFWDLRDAYDWVMRFIDFYNNRRVHGKLKMSPKEFSKLTHLHTQENYIQAI